VAPLLTRSLLALALVLLASVGSARAEGRRVAVVIDRSGSLRHADPEAEGLASIVEALALGLRGGDRLALGLSGGEELSETSVQALESALPVLQRLLAAKPRPGGADLQALLLQASAWAGSGGTVVVYSDDDLDVIQGGQAPPAALALAREEAKGAAPARDAVNRAARSLLRRAVLGQKSRPRWVALKLALPAGAGATPFLEALGAEIVTPGKAAVARLAARIRGAAIVGEQLRLEPSQRELKLPFPARIVVRATKPIQLSGAQKLDREGRLWSLEITGPLALPDHGGAWVSVAPTLSEVEDVFAYRLRAGGVRVVAPGAKSGTVLARQSGREFLLEGQPAQARLGGVAEIKVARVLGSGGSRVVGPARSVSLGDAEVQILAAGEPRVGKPLSLSGQLPPGFVAADLVVEVSEGGGRRERVSFSEAGQKVSATYVPRGVGPLELRARGPLAIRLAAPLEVSPAPTYTLEIVSVRQGSVEVDAEHPLPRSGAVELKLTLTVRPKPPEPIQAVLTLSGVDGLEVKTRSLTLQEEQEVDLSLELPADLPEATRSLGVALEPVGGATLPGRRSLPLKAPKSWKQSAIAIGLMVLALVWFLIVWISRRRDLAYVGLEVGRKQVRTIGTNGRISPERYLFSQNFLSREEGVLIEPEDSIGGALAFRVREDGAVECLAKDGAKLIHQDRPTVLAASMVVEHGTAFAMVYGQRALRYVYLEEEPTGDELANKIFGDQASYEEEIRDSGVFMILDDDENIPKASARMEASAEILFPSSQQFESSEEVNVVPSDSGRQYPVSDEGIVVMNSDEGKILDSADLDLLTSGEIRAAEAEFDALGMDISLGDIMPSGSDTGERPPEE
jgi:hypothetical protein